MEMNYNFTPDELRLIYESVIELRDLSQHLDAMAKAKAYENILFKLRKQLNID